VLQHLDFSGLNAANVEKVKNAIVDGENFYGYIPNDGISFIIQNYIALKALGVLEAAWLDAYVHASNFSTWPFETIKSVFKSCDKNKLRSLKPIDEMLGRLTNGRITVFRGCAGPLHNMGMSWIQSLDKAIWYAARHVELCDLKNPVVYVATISLDEIYCQLDHYDADLIVIPMQVWTVNVPVSEFQVNRPR
jgi:hypothetical protein